MPKIIPPIQTYRTKEEYAYDVLRNAILSAQIKPGERLVIDQLSEEIKVSPIPIRSALQRLQSEGLVDIVPHSGAVVSEISPESIGEIFQLLETLECMAFRQSAERVAAEDIQKLEELAAKMDAAMEARNVNQWADYNDTFHRSIAEISGLTLVADLTGRTLDHWTRIWHCCYRPAMAARLPEAQAEHHRMIELLRAGDGEALARLAAHHNRASRKAYGA